MSSLQNLIADGNYASAQAAYDAIITPSVEVRDDELYTWAGVALIAGPVGAETLRIALQENGMGWVVHQLGGRGIQLSNELVQQALLGFAQAGLPGCAELAATGLSLITPYQQAGIAEPTLQQVTDAWNVWKAETDLAALRDSLRVHFDSILNQIGTTEQPLAIAELRAIANELEA
jgi:hypothetical protein